MIPKGKQLLCTEWQGWQVVNKAYSSRNANYSPEGLPEFTQCIIL